MIFYLGPFQFYRSKDGTLDISIKAIEHWPFGWEYGWEDHLCEWHPWIHIRVGRLVVFSFEPSKSGFELRVLGFWWAK